MAMSYYALFSPAFAGVTEMPSTGDGSGYMHMTYTPSDKSFTYAQSSRIELKQTGSDRFHFLHFELAGTIQANKAIHTSGSGYIVNDTNSGADGYLTFRGCKKFEFYSDADYQGVYAGGL